MSGESRNLSPITLQKYLKGQIYPAQKDDLIRTARTNGAPSAVLRLLENFPDRNFGQPLDVTKSLKGAGTPTTLPS
jgi:hypothetical protein